MSCNSVMFLLGLSLLVFGANSKTINFIDTCPINDDACTLASAKKAMPHLVLGNEDLGIESLDPISFSKINGDIDTLKIAFDTLTILGVSQCELLVVKRPEELKIYVEVVCPISAHGQYVVGGELLGFKIYGHGPFKFSATQLKFTVSISLGVVDGKDGEKHYKVLKFDFTYDPLGKVNIELQNLYDGDEKQAEPMNKLIAEQPTEIFNLVGKNVLTEIIKKVVNAIARLFHKLTLKETNG